MKKIIKTRGGRSIEIYTSRDLFRILGFNKLKPGKKVLDYDGKPCTIKGFGKTIYGEIVLWYLKDGTKECSHWEHNGIMETRLKLL
jgi:hypothetical protein